MKKGVLIVKLGLTKEEKERQRIGIQKYTKRNELIKIIECCENDYVIVEFQDEWKRTKKVQWSNFKTGYIRNPHDDERLGLETITNNGEKIKIVEYNSSQDIIVEFQDEWKRRKKIQWGSFKNGTVRNPHDDEIRLFQKNINYQGSEMQCIKYNNARNIVIKFNDKYGAEINTSWSLFINGEIKNPYFPDFLGVGMNGMKYPLQINGKETKEHYTWKNMLRRCFDEKEKEKHPTYKDVTCCEEWLLYENFYEWLHSQENFDKWLNGDRWSIDKDIIIKGNKVYSPDACCLVPDNINNLFTKANALRGNYPIGVYKDENREGYTAHIIYGKKNNYEKHTRFQYPTPEEAFYAYKEYKENYIKRIAQEEYNKGNITKICYDAMMDYKVEITD